MTMIPFSPRARQLEQLDQAIETALSGRAVARIRDANADLTEAKRARQDAAAVLNVTAAKARARGDRLEAPALESAQLSFENSEAMVAAKRATVRAATEVAMPLVHAALSEPLGELRKMVLAHLAELEQTLEPLLRLQENFYLLGMEGTRFSSIGGMLADHVRAMRVLVEGRG